MPLTALDLNTALIVVDLQKGLLGGPLAHPMADVLARTRALLDAFRERALPVVLVNVAGRAPGRTEQPPRALNLSDGFTDFLPELDPQPGDLVVTKRTWGAFVHTDLEAQLRSRGVTQVVIVGVATSAGVESTARQAYELGFHVTLATDVMTDRSAEAHANSLTHVFPRLGETGSTDDILRLLRTRN